MADNYCFSCGEGFESCDCEEPETYSTCKPHCPHCGHMEDDDDPDPRYYEEADFEIDCSSCGKKFNVEVSISFSYTCTRTPTKQ